VSPPLFSFSNQDSVLVELYSEERGPGRSVVPTHTTAFLTFWPCVCNCGQVLKYGSMIVDNLRVFQHPVFVYIPHEAEIRGGAWVVIDPNINPAQMEMYAADVCRGGVLEPEACAQLKYPETDIIKTMHRLDPNIASMSPEEQEVPYRLRLRRASGHVPGFFRFF